MKMATVKTTVVKLLMGIVFAALLLTAIPASGSATAITAHAATKNVKPAAVKKITKVKVTKNAISIKWPKSKNATGYQIRAYKGSKLAKKATVKAAKATVKGLNADTAYKISVRAYRKSGKKTTYSAWKSAKIKTVKPPTKSKKPKQPQNNDAELAKKGNLWAPMNVERNARIPENETVYWANTPKGLDASKITWELSDKSIIKLTPKYIDGNKRRMAVEPLKDGTVTVTLKYAGYVVGAKDIIIYSRPADYVYWEERKGPGDEYYDDYIKPFNEWINDWVAKNITDGMSEYEKAEKAATFVHQCMIYDYDNMETRRYEITLKSWKEGLGVCKHAAHITSLFLTKMGIENTFNDLSRQDHVNNWAVLDGQAYIIESVFWGDGDKANHNVYCNGNGECWHTASISKTDMTKEEAETPK